MFNYLLVFPGSRKWPCDVYTSYLAKQYISLMLVKKGIVSKWSKRVMTIKVAITAYYAGEKRGMCRVNVLVSMATHIINTTVLIIWLNIHLIYWLNIHNRKL